MDGITVKHLGHRYLRSILSRGEQTRHADDVGGMGQEVQVTKFDHETACGRQQAWFLQPKEWHSVCVFVHGTGNDAFFPYGILLRELLRRGYVVATFDLDGHGASSSGTLNLPNLPLSLRQFLRKLPQRFPVLENQVFHLFGHSLGAVVIKNLLTSYSSKLGVPIATAAYLSLPARVAVTIKSIAWELAGFFTPSYRSHIKEFGLWVSLPAVGFFKRSEYPIRLEMDDGGLSYIHKVQSYIQSSSQSPSWAATSSLVPELYIHGDRDYLIDPYIPVRNSSAELDSAHDSSSTPANTKVVKLKGETHLSLCASREAASEVIKFFDQHV